MRRRRPAGGGRTGGGPGELIGRQEALDAVEGLLAADSLVRVLVVHGAAGMGKSALVAHVAGGDLGGYRPVVVDIDPVVRGLTEPV
ncbi:MAG TPA: hypothetical protein VFP72_16890, partial [Kineosporiaceae bacterium]|nr:hypothetical protein [Kineosporiaceae bacterium]